MTSSRNSIPILLSIAIAHVVGFLCVAEQLSAQPAAASAEKPLQVVTTIPDYAWVAREIGGDRVEAEAISRGDQDAHFVRPKPSFQTKLRTADMFISTGLDLELWAPTLLDAAGNRDVLEGAPGYVAAWTGIELLDKPTTVSRSEGDVHVYGNPHIHTDPLNMIIVARNVLAGLEKLDPANTDYYREREAALEERLHRRLFGDELVDLLRQVSERDDLVILGWCLLGNHYHLVLRQGSVDVSRPIKTLQQNTTRLRNIRDRVYGPLPARQVQGEGDQRLILSDAGHRLCSPQPGHGRVG